MANSNVLKVSPVDSGHANNVIIASMCCGGGETIPSANRVVTTVSATDLLSPCYESQCPMCTMERYCKKHWRNMRAAKHNQEALRADLEKQTTVIATTKTIKVQVATGNNSKAHIEAYADYVLEFKAREALDAEGFPASRAVAHQFYSFEGFGKRFGYNKGPRKVTYIDKVVPIADKTYADIVRAPPINEPLQAVVDIVNIAIAHPNWHKYLEPSFSPKTDWDYTDLLWGFEPANHCIVHDTDNWADDPVTTDFVFFWVYHRCKACLNHFDVHRLILPCFNCFLYMMFHFGTVDLQLKSYNCDPLTRKIVDRSSNHKGDGPLPYMGLFTGYIGEPFSAYNIGMFIFDYTIDNWLNHDGECGGFTAAFIYILLLFILFFMVCWLALFIAWDMFIDYYPFLFGDMHGRESLYFFHLFVWIVFTSIICGKLLVFVYAIYSIIYHAITHLMIRCVYGSHVGSYQPTYPEFDPWENFTELFSAGIHGVVSMDTARCEGILIARVCSAKIVGAKKIRPIIYNPPNNDGLCIAQCLNYMGLNVAVLDDKHMMQDILYYKNYGVLFTILYLCKNEGKATYELLWTIDLDGFDRLSATEVEQKLFKRGIVTMDYICRQPIQNFCVIVYECTIGEILSKPVNNGKHTIGHCVLVNMGVVPTQPLMSSAVVAPIFKNKTVVEVLMGDTNLMLVDNKTIVMQSEATEVDTSNVAGPSGIVAADIEPIVEPIVIKDIQINDVFLPLVECSTVTENIISTVYKTFSIKDSILLRVPAYFEKTGLSFVDFNAEIYNSLVISVNSIEDNFDYDKYHKQLVRETWGSLRYMTDKEGQRLQYSVINGEAQVVSAIVSYLLRNKVLKVKRVGFITYILNFPYSLDEFTFRQQLLLQEFIEEALNTHKQSAILGRNLFIDKLEQELRHFQIQFNNGKIDYYSNVSYLWNLEFRSLSLCRPVYCISFYEVYCVLIYFIILCYSLINFGSILNWIVLILITRQELRRPTFNLWFWKSNETIRQRNYRYYMIAKSFFSFRYIHLPSKIYNIVKDNITLSDNLKFYAGGPNTLPVDIPCKHCGGVCTMRCTSNSAHERWVQENSPNYIEGNYFGLTKRAINFHKPLPRRALKCFQSLRKSGPRCGATVYGFTGQFTSIVPQIERDSMITTYHDRVQCQERTFSQWIDTLGVWLVAEQFLPAMKVQCQRRTSIGEYIRKAGFDAAKKRRYWKAYEAKLNGTRRIPKPKSGKCMLKHEKLQLQPLNQLTSYCVPKAIRAIQYPSIDVIIDTAPEVDSFYSVLTNKVKGVMGPFWDIATIASGKNNVEVGKLLGGLTHFPYWYESDATKYDKSWVSFAYLFIRKWMIESGWDRDVVRLLDKQQFMRVRDASGNTWVEPYTMRSGTAQTTLFNSLLMVVLISTSLVLSGYKVDKDSVRIISSGDDVIFATSYPVDTLLFANNAFKMGFTLKTKAVTPVTATFLGCHLWPVLTMMGCVSWAMAPDMGRSFVGIGMSRLPQKYPLAWWKQVCTGAMTTYSPIPGMVEVFYRQVAQISTKRHVHIDSLAAIKTGNIVIPNDVENWFDLRYPGFPIEKLLCATPGDNILFPDIFFEKYTR